MNDKADNGGPERPKQQSFVDKVDDNAGNGDPLQPPVQIVQNFTIQLIVLPEGPERSIASPHPTIHDPTSRKPLEFMAAFLAGAVVLTVLAVWVGQWPKWVAVVFGTSVSGLFLWLMRARSLVFQLGGCLVTLITLTVAWVGAPRLAAVCQLDDDHAAANASPTVIAELCSNPDTRDLLVLVADLKRPSVEAYVAVSVFVLLLAILIVLIPRYTDKH